MTTLYIAGPMTGLADFNYPAFNDAAASLRAAGYTVLNPAENKPESTHPEWADWMRLGLAQVLQADGLAMLPGWTYSQGAKLEHLVAARLGIEIRSIYSWLRGES